MVALAGSLALGTGCTSDENADMLSAMRCQRTGDNTFQTDGTFDVTLDRAGQSFVLFVAVPGDDSNQEYIPTMTCGVWEAAGDGAPGCGRLQNQPSTQTVSVTASGSFDPAVLSGVDKLSVTVVAVAGARTYSTDLDCPR
jgi:hypothetical protein